VIDTRHLICHPFIFVIEHKYNSNSFIPQIVDCIGISILTPVIFLSTTQYYEKGDHTPHKFDQTP
jgi:hypothetical protein